MKALIADDDRMHLQLVSGRLKGVNVVAAFDAMQAWMIATQSLPDAIVLDIQMPGATGFEVLRKLKATAKTSMIPVIVLSGSINPIDEARVRGLGAAEFLRKPVDISQLLGALRKLVGSSPSESAG